MMMATLRAVILTLVGVFRGFPITAEKMATHWTEEALKAIPGLRLYARHIYWVMYVFAIITLIIGWIITSYLTVWIIGVIF
jgi:hypothetical protein